MTGWCALSIVGLAIMIAVLVLARRAALKERK